MPDIGFTDQKKKKKNLPFRKVIIISKAPNFLYIDFVE